MKKIIGGYTESKIKQVRLAKGLTLQEVADKVGTSYQQIYKLENNKRRLTVEWLERIANALNVAPDDLTFQNLSYNEIKPIYRVGFVEAGVFTECFELPRDEWENVNYAVDNLLKDKNIFALGVRGNSMNKIFPPEQTTLICIDIKDFYNLRPSGIKNGDFVIAQCTSPDGKYESTVKRYNKLEDGTIILEAMSTDPRYNNIVVGTQTDCEYTIRAVVIDYQTKLIMF